jgi:hypothetical protein
LAASLQVGYWLNFGQDEKIHTLVPKTPISRKRLFLKLSVYAHSVP